METKTYQEMRQRAITLMVFNYSNKFGLRKMCGEAEYKGAMALMKELFGEKEYVSICDEAMGMINK